MGDETWHRGQERPPLSEIRIELNHIDCEERSCQDHHPCIDTYYVDIMLVEDQSKIGYIKVYTFSSADTTRAGDKMEECKAYDEVHTGAQMTQVDNYLANENLFAGKDVLVSEARALVFVEEVWLEDRVRGKGYSLAALRATLIQLGPPLKSVVLLQAGSVGGSHLSMVEADEKLTRHWGRLGFRSWSDSDDSWLCLSLQDEVHGLAALKEQIPSETWKMGDK